MNISQIKADIDFLCGSTSATYSDTNKIRNVNVAYQDIARLIWESDDGWQYDDTNANTLAIGTSSLVHNQQDYALPSTTQKLESVIIKDNSGNWLKLKQIDIYDTTMAMPEVYKTPGLPQYYDLIGRSVMLYPTPSSAYATMTSGIQVYVSRDVAEFIATATSTTPGFATAFHRVLSYAAALDFSQDEVQRKFLAGQKARLENGLTRFYSKRNTERKVAVIPNGKRNWRQYL